MTVDDASLGDPVERRLPPAMKSVTRRRVSVTVGISPPHHHRRHGGRVRLFSLARARTAGRRASWSTSRTAMGAAVVKIADTGDRREVGGHVVAAADHGGTGRRVATHHVSGFRHVTARSSKLNAEIARAGQKPAVEISTSCRGPLPAAELESPGKSVSGFLDLVGVLAMKSPTRYGFPATWGNGPPERGAAISTSTPSARSAPLILPRRATREVQLPNPYGGVETEDAHARRNHRPADAGGVVQLACAPSLHNCQPWRLIAGDGQLRLFLQPHRHQAADQRPGVVMVAAPLLDHPAGRRRRRHGVGRRRRALPQSTTSTIWPPSTSAAANWSRRHPGTPTDPGLLRSAAVRDRRADPILQAAAARRSPSRTWRRAARAADSAPPGDRGRPG